LPWVLRDDEEEEEEEEEGEEDKKAKDDHTWLKVNTERLGLGACLKLAHLISLSALRLSCVRCGVSPRRSQQPRLQDPN
jgi:hypothetical protein